MKEVWFYPDPENPYMRFRAVVDRHLFDEDMDLVIQAQMLDGSIHEIETKYRNLKRYYRELSDEEPV